MSELKESMPGSIPIAVREVIVFGAGSAGRRVRRALLEQGVRVRAFCDNDPVKQGTIIEETPVIAPATLDDLPPLPIVISSIYRDQIREQLAALDCAALVVNYPGPEADVIKKTCEAEQDVIHTRISKIERDAIMPSFMFHKPMDYKVESYPPKYPPPVSVPGEPFPIPPAEARPGYAPDDDSHYLQWGRSDHDFILSLVEKHYGLKKGIAVLDFGCAAGRVLRHFYRELKERDWILYGTDIQAYLVEWMRRYFPPGIRVLSGSTFPHLPFKDSSLDVVYGISVFTHTKYLWDMWLEEFRRVLKPGGLCLQSVQCETAWRFYHEHREEEWVRQGHPADMLEKRDMDEDFLFYGDGLNSQVFYREEVIKAYWGRHMRVIDFLTPPSFSYQNWIALTNE